jgi:hypothetical protein
MQYPWTPDPRLLLRQSAQHAKYRPPITHNNFPNHKFSQRVKDPLISPIASGKPGGRRPRAISLLSVKISIIVLGVLDRSSTLSEGSSTRMQTLAVRVPRGGHFRPAPMPYYTELRTAVGMHGGYHSRISRIPRSFPRASA